MPVRMFRPQAVVVGEKVYVGGGDTANFDEHFQVFQFDPSRDEWSCLTSCQVALFALAQFMGNLITVGGLIRGGGDAVTGKVYCFKEQSQKWEEFLKPMPTARTQLTLATTQTTIVASGGNAGYRNGKPVECAKVEVYSSETSRWYTADSLPIPCAAMTSVTIEDTWYQLGGCGTGKNITTVLYASLTALIQKATSPTQVSADRMSVWKTLPDAPQRLSGAASLGGDLLAVGGYEDVYTPNSRIVHIFVPKTNSWGRTVHGNLPEPCCACTAVPLSSKQVLVVGGKDNQNKHTKTVFRGYLQVTYVKIV